MRYEDLDAKTRAQVDAQIGRKPRQKRSRKAATEGTTKRWRCRKCGTIYTSQAAFDRSTCTILECVIEPTGAR